MAKCPLKCKMIKEWEEIGKNKNKQKYAGHD